MRGISTISLDFNHPDERIREGAELNILDFLLNEAQPGMKIPVGFSFFCQQNFQIFLSLIGI